MPKPKYIFCTGGVVSSVGKGVTAAAIGRILKARGLKVAIQKLDPYLNVDPGTMSPYQHGEVYVTADGAETEGIPVAAEEADTPPQRQFFEYAGPLYSARIAPAACTEAVGTSRKLQALARDVSRRTIADGVDYTWRVLDGAGLLEDAGTQYVTYFAPEEPCLVRIGVSARQGDVICDAAALITVTDSLLPDVRDRQSARHGLPGYTLEHAPGKLWRSRYDAEQNLIVVNSGHRDFIYASRVKALKLRYLVRLYAKEMVRKNFPGLPADQLLDRLIELSLYTEEHLR